MPLDWKIDKEDVIHLHNEVVHNGKNNDILKFESKWVDLENIILSELNQTQKEKYNMYVLISGF